MSDLNKRFGRKKPKPLRRITEDKALARIPDDYAWKPGVDDDISAVDKVAELELQVAELTAENERLQSSNMDLHKAQMKADRQTGGAAGAVAGVEAIADQQVNDLMIWIADLNAELKGFIGNMQVEIRNSERNRERAVNAWARLVGKIEERYGNEAPLPLLWISDMHQWFIEELQSEASDFKQIIASNTPPGTMVGKQSISYLSLVNKQEAVARISTQLASHLQTILMIPSEICYEIWVELQEFRKPFLTTIKRLDRKWMYTEIMSGQRYDHSHLHAGLLHAWRFEITYYPEYETVEVAEAQYISDYPKITTRTLKRYKTWLKKVEKHADTGEFQAATS